MAGNDDQMLKEHQKTFDGFIKLITYSTIGIVVVLAGMALFLV